MHVFRTSFKAPTGKRSTVTEDTARGQPRGRQKGGL